jgi:hypothetical protein
MSNWFKKAPNKVINIYPSPSEDVVAYRIRACKNNKSITYDDEFYETTIDKLSIPISKIPFVKRGNHNFYVSAVDRVGNESDFFIALGIKL